MLVGNAHCGGTYDEDNPVQAYPHLSQTSSQLCILPAGCQIQIILHHWEDDMTFQNGDLCIVLCFLSCTV